MRDEPREGRFEAAEVAHDPENEVLAAGRSAPVMRRQRVEEGVESLAAFEPARNQASAATHAAGRASQLLRSLARRRHTV